MTSRPIDGTAATTTVLLLRHGQSTWNLEHRWQGSLDSPLTRLGRAQAAWAAERLATVAGFHSVHTSDLGRAVETATIIASAIEAGPPIADARWREAAAGEWEGRLVDEIERDWPGWLATRRRPPAFEPEERVVERARSALGALPPGRHLVVTHSGLARAVVRRHGGVDERIPNLGGVWVEHGPGGWRLGPGWPAPPSARRRDHGRGEDAEER